MNTRKKDLTGIIGIIVFLIFISISGCLFSEAALKTDFTQKNIVPCLRHPFGTDWMGREMLFRSLKGISISVIIGGVTAICSSVIAVILGICAATMGKKVDVLISWFVDLIMGIPHMLLLILICVACGRGIKGVVLGVTLTHWPSLCRIIRAEILQLKEMPYIKIAKKTGKSYFYIIKKHMLPHIIPQYMTGLILIFPHAILHESSITFLGFGLTNEQPAIGIILSESMKYLVTGKWWLALFPGILLVIIVYLFYLLGEKLREC